MSAESRAASAGIKGRHVLMMLVAFFGVVFAVNGVFLASALRTYTGVVSAEPYVKGLKYNERIEAGERQARLGWADALSLDIDGEVVLRLSDDAGRPLRGLKFRGTIGRPSTNRLDRQILLIEAEPGQYVARSGALDEGTWLVSLEGRSRDFGEDPVYRIRRRVWLKR